MKAAAPALAITGLLLFGFAPRTQAQSQTIFTSQTPAWVNQSQGANQNYEVGIVFQSKLSGEISAVRFWKDSRESGAHTGHIWSASGQLLASVTFAGETASGWQQQSLSTPLLIAASVSYVVSVNTAGSYYVMTERGLASAVVNGSLSTIVGNNGLYGQVGRFPKTTWNHSNYFRDVVFIPSASVQSETYTISGSVSPASAGSGAGVSLSGGAVQSTTANASGNYSFVNVAPGNYAVTVSKSGYTVNPSSTAVSVTNSDVAGIDFVVGSASSIFSISGTISGSGGNGATVTLSGAASATTIANSSGAYSFTGLAKGSYVVTPTSSNATFSPPSQNVTVVSSSQNTVNFTGTATTSSNVIFDDEFTAATLSSEWYAMSKFGDSSNGELQCYTPSQDVLSGGYLAITSAAQSVSCGPNGSSKSSYNSGMVTWSTFNFTYGTVEFRTKMAGGQGPWPAIWLLGYHCEPTNAYWSAAAGNCNWPAPGSDEIDITEILNSDHTSVNQQLHSNGHNDGCTASAADVSQNFHVYQFIWSTGSMIWKIDGNTTCTIKQSYVPNTPMFLIINTAMGGSGGSISNSTLPQSMQVDYVKITQP